jgi:hypothetical protein
MHMKLPAPFGWQTPPLRHGLGEHGFMAGVVTAVAMGCTMPMRAYIVIVRLLMSQVRPV